MFVRVEVAVKPEFTDPTANAILRKIELSHPDIRRQIRWARVLDVYWVEIDSPREQVIPVISEIFQDQVMNWLFTGDLIPSAAGNFGGIMDLFDSAPYHSGRFVGVEKRFRPGVTDNVSKTVIEAFQIVMSGKSPNIKAASGNLFLLEAASIEDNDIARIAKDVFCNELIESWTLLPQEELKKNTRFHPEHVKREIPKIETKGGYKVEKIALTGLSETELAKLSDKKLWALTVEEMKSIRDYFNDAEQLEKRKKYGLDQPTDVELEVIAQTWSEHCKHKIFNAEIKYRNSTGEQDKKIPNEIQSLFKQTISGTTDEIPRPWLLSVFSDNAGIIALDDKTAFCMKVETHNSPSALDPYGGALTGIVGVNRDILGCGMGAKPIFNTDVFCLAVPDYFHVLPEKILHPRRILDGVRKGVEHGGNKSGIPTVNGALVFDSRYLGKPIIYCGTGGVMPRKIGDRKCESKEVKNGDKVCMIGGRIGKDGIHGATFSSLALNETSPVTAVQLGDPMTQKRVHDFLFEARDKGYYRTLTDNGAGGLSSSVGELAQISGGAKIDVSLAKTKYPGLKPYELVVSESQERMTVVVDPEILPKFLELAEKRNVEVSVLGEFNDSGYFEIYYGDKVIALLSLQFMHTGVPKMKLNAEWTDSTYIPGTIEMSFENEGSKHLIELLSRPNIASKEWMIRQYDHEVQGNSVIKPLHTVFPGTNRAASGPNDASVMKINSDTYLGIAVGCGINPKLSMVDPYLMAQSVVDEAIRNVISVGAEYGNQDCVLALIDNYCWSDPVGDPQKTAALVRACYGMRDAALGLGIPLISGKDSMKNDFKGKKEGKDVVISVPPTLLMTAVAKISDFRLSRTADFKNDGDRIYLLGGSEFGLLGSELHSMYMDRLRDKGGHERQVVLPVSKISGNTDATNEFGRITASKPNWELAKNVYAWLGGNRGKKQILIRSVHDVSEGGLLVSIAECMLARELGIYVEFPEGIDPWSFAFGEGFHSFVVSVKDIDSQTLEEEWKELSVPYLSLGKVTHGDQFQVYWKSISGRKHWSVPVRSLSKAWRKEGYWE